METGGARKTYLDALRIFACLGVLYNHIAGQSAQFYDRASGAAALWLFFVSKTAVALFFMISGALLLNREDSYGKAWRRVLRMALALILFSTIYYSVGVARAGAPFRPVELLQDIWRYGSSGTYWFLYAYLGVLVMMPILQRLAARLTKNDARYFMLWSLGIAGAMDILLIYMPEVQYNGSFALPLFASVLGMLIAGRYFDACAPSRGRTILAAAAAVLLPLVPTVVVYALDRGAFGLFDNYDALTATGAALGIFLLCRRLDERLHLAVGVRAWISRLGQLTFGVYLLGDLLIRLLEPVRAWIQTAVGVNVAACLFVAIVFAIGALLTFLLRCIPGVKRLL